MKWCDHKKYRSVKAFHDNELFICDSCNTVIGSAGYEPVSAILKELEGYKNEKMQT